MLIVTDASRQPISGREGGWALRIISTPFLASPMPSSTMPIDENGFVQFTRSCGWHGTMIGGMMPGDCCNSDHPSP
jgi:hypothetical protein